jgi:hypothetical protein
VDHTDTICERNHNDYIMATSTDVTQRDMLSLVLRSRKALDHTKSLCSRAQTLASQSTNLALEVVATNAKVRWASDMISEQTKVYLISRLLSYINNSFDSLSLSEMLLKLSALRRVDSSKMQR